MWASGSKTEAAEAKQTESAEAGKAQSRGGHNDRESETLERRQQLA